MGFKEKIVYWGIKHYNNKQTNKHEDKMMNREQGVSWFQETEYTKNRKKWRRKQEAQGTKKVIDRDPLVQYCSLRMTRQ